MANLKRSLKEAVRKLAYSTSVDQLKKRGVTKVNVLGIDRVVALIDEAVHRSLRDRLLSVEREAVVDATKEEFLRLLKRNEALEKSHSELQRARERAEEELTTLRLERQKLQQELEQRLDEALLDRRARYAGEDERILKEVQTIFSLPGSENGKLQERVLALVMRLVNQERKEAETAHAEVHDREVGMLQRRIRKLSESLEVTEKRLVEVAQMKDVEFGIASIYREVQGLSAADTRYERKKEMMSDIFKANLALQKKP